MATNDGSGRVVGRVGGVWRYPVKSMPGQFLESALCGWHGISGDRRWSFVRRGAEGSGFPWLTLRRDHRLAQYVPSLVDPSAPERSAVTVRTPSGESLEVTDARLAAELGEGIYALKQDTGVFDVMPLSLVTTQSIAAIAQRVGVGLAPERFRPNLVIEAVGDAPFSEDAWVGATLQIGGARVRVDQRDKRCMVVNLDPKRAERNPAVLKTIVEDRQGYVGVYGSVVTPGTLRVGDRVVLVE